MDNKSASDKNAAFLPPSPTQVGWLLSVLDKVLDKTEQPPAVSVLPLGTGNDLSRSLGELEGPV